MTLLTAIGLMSGTSLDGVDVALIETDGERVARPGPAGYRPYTPAERALLRQALAEAAALRDRAARPGAVGEAEKMITAAHAEAVETFLSENAIAPHTVAAIGFHGQTVLHRPKARLTVQIGDGEVLAARLKLPVACDFRAADVAAGGEGAPLAPAYHRALAQNLDVKKPIAVVNIGGVSNITFLDGERDPLAFDAGPGNAPIDDFIRARSGASHDADGALAAKGKVDEGVIARVLAELFFAAPPPKSLDRAAFARLPLEYHSLEDGAATATATVAAAIVRAFDHLPRRPASLIVVGGGTRNLTLLAMLRARAGATVLRGDDVGWRPDSIEAEAFAYLAVRALKGLPLSFPTTTGVPKPTTGGIIVKPA